MKKHVIIYIYTLIYKTSFFTALESFCFLCRCLTLLVCASCHLLLRDWRVVGFERAAVSPGEATEKS